MHLDLDSVYAVALTVTLWITALGVGASHDPRSVRAGVDRPGLVIRLLVLDVVVVPCIVLGLVRLVSVPDDLAVGLVIVGTASAGPLGLKTAQLARGDVPLAITLVVGLELLNIVAMPLWAAIAIPSVVSVPLAEIIRTLLVGVLVPLSIGFAGRAWAPVLARRVARWAPRLSTIALGVVIAVVLARDGAAVLAALGSGVPTVAVATILTAMVLGWWLGGPDPASRRTAALVSSVRANVVALAVASTAVGAAAPATSAIVVFGLCSLLVVPPIAVLVGRRSARFAPGERYASAADAPRTAPAG